MAVATGILWVEALDTTKYPTMYQTLYKELLV